MNTVRLRFTNDQLEIHDMELPLEKKVSAWNGMALDPQKGFAWIPPSRKVYSPIWLMLIPLIFLIPFFCNTVLARRTVILNKCIPSYKSQEQKLDA